MHQVVGAVVAKGADPRHGHSEFAADVVEYVESQLPQCGEALARLSAVDRALVLPERHVELIMDNLHLPVPCYDVGKGGGAEVEAGDVVPGVAEGFLEHAFDHVLLHVPLDHDDALDPGPIRGLGEP